MTCLLAVISVALEGTFASIHASFGSFKDVKSKVLASRGQRSENLALTPIIVEILLSGVTLAAANTRKAPNAFNYLRQIGILNRAGAGSVQTQLEAVWFCVLKHLGVYADTL